MKIRQQLALRFTLVSALLTGAILVLIFFVTRGFVHADFVERLTQQSRLEVIHYATPTVRDVVSSGSLFLVNPSTSIYSKEGELLYKSGDVEISNAWISTVQTTSLLNAERGSYTTVGRRYDIAGKQYLVFISDKDLPGQHELDILVKAMFVGWTLSLLFAYLAGLYFSSKALEPVKHVVTEVNHITHDNLGHRLTMNKPVGAVDEIDELILTFNALLTRIENAFVAQKRFVQNASHELKTPLTAIMAEAELALARDRSKEEYKRTLSVVVSESERLVNITQGLLTLARLEEGSFSSIFDRISVKTLVEGTFAIFKLHHPDKTLSISTSSFNGSLQGNLQLLQNALLNVLDNAAKYSTREIQVTAIEEENNFHFTVRDFGIGIPAAELDRILTPLFRASNVNTISGAGLGLPLVNRILQAHHGRLTVTSEEGVGTCCDIQLPLVV